MNQPHILFDRLANGAFIIVLICLIIVVTDRSPVFNWTLLVAVGGGIMFWVGIACKIISEFLKPRIQE